MAARLEQAAGAGEIIVGEETFRLLGSSVKATPIEPLVVKGSTMPLRAWRVDGLVATPARGWHSGGTYLGRRAELEQVRDAYRSVVGERRAAAALVVAPPGFGKTRFAAEAAAGLTPAARVVIGRAIADGGSTYGPIVDILRRSGRRRGATRKATLEGSLARLADGAQVARAARALEDGTGVATTGEVAWVTRRVVTAVAADGPLLIVLDDLHWADPLLLDVVAELVEPPLAAPVLVLALTRPELAGERADWIARMPTVPILRLQPLSAEDTDRLVGDRLGPDADDVQRRRIVDAAAGVPLFVEQWAALDAETSDEAVPSSIRALMAARIDHVGGDSPRDPGDSRDRGRGIHAIRPGGHRIDRPRSIERSPRWRVARSSAASRPSTRAISSATRSFATL